MADKSTKNVVLLVLAVLVAVVLVAWIAWEMLLAPPTFTAVSLSSGELYFGQVQNFPNYGLSNVYTIQLTGNQQNPLSIQRFRNTFWGPEDFMKINKDYVVWSAELDDRSDLLNLIQQNPDLLPQQPAGQAAPTQNQQGNTATPTVPAQESGQ